MPTQPLSKGVLYYDGILNAVLQADGTVSMQDYHNFNMLWPAKTPFSLHDGSIARLYVCQYDPTALTVDYHDSNLSIDVQIDLINGIKKSSALKFVAQTTNVSKTTTQNTTKPPFSKKVAFSKGAILFHTTSKDKWIFDGMDNAEGYFILKGMSDKTKVMHVSEKDIVDFEEIFF